MASGDVQGDETIGSLGDSLGRTPTLVLGVDPTLSTQATYADTSHSVSIAQSPPLQSMFKSFGSAIFPKFFQTRAEIRTWGAHGLSDPSVQPIPQGSRPPYPYFPAPLPGYSVVSTGPLLRTPPIEFKLLHKYGQQMASPDKYYEIDTSCHPNFRKSTCRYDYQNLSDTTMTAIPYPNAEFEPIPPYDMYLGSANTVSYPYGVPAVEDNKESFLTTSVTHVQMAVEENPSLKKNESISTFQAEYDVVCEQLKNLLTLSYVKYEVTDEGFLAGFQPPSEASSETQIVFDTTELGILSSEIRVTPVELLITINAVNSNIHKYIECEIEAKIFPGYPLITPELTLVVIRHCPNRQTRDEIKELLVALLNEWNPTFTLLSIVTRIHEILVGNRTELKNASRRRYHSISKRPPCSPRFESKEDISIYGKNFTNEHEKESFHFSINQKNDEAKLPLTSKVENTSLVTNMKKSKFEGRCVRSLRRRISRSPITSRYYREFEELELIGEGAFGCVLKVRRREGFGVYAVKRIPILATGDDNVDAYAQFCDEASLLAKLNHPNIVRYYNAWIESARDQPSTNNSRMKKRDDEFYDPSLSSINGDVGTIVSEPEQTNNFYLIKNKQRESLDNSSVKSLPSPSPIEKSLSKSASGPGNYFSKTSFINRTIDNKNNDLIISSSVEPEIRGYLYILMEYCPGRTLREAIDAGAFSQNPKKIWALYKQLLEGLCHLHSLGIIHRDLKPSNIFLIADTTTDELVAKIGDFGLTTTVCNQKENSQNNNLLGNLLHSLSTGVGTIHYMAPEQATCSYYNQKADMFSLGVIFFEMWHPPFNTGMERSIVMESLGSYGFSKEFFENSFEGGGGKSFFHSASSVQTSAINIIRSLLNKQPENRPNAKQLLLDFPKNNTTTSIIENNKIYEVLSSLPYSNESLQVLCALFGKSETLNRIKSCLKSYSNLSIKGLLAQQISIYSIKYILSRRGAILIDLPLIEPLLLINSKNAKKISKENEQKKQNQFLILDQSGTPFQLRYNLFNSFAAISHRHHTLDPNNIKAKAVAVKRKKIQRSYTITHIYKDLDNQLMKQGNKNISSNNHKQDNINYINNDFKYNTTTFPTENLLAFFDITVDLSSLFQDSNHEKRIPAAATTAQCSCSSNLGSSSSILSSMFDAELIAASSEILYYFFSNNNSISFKWTHVQMLPIFLKNFFLIPSEHVKDFDNWLRTIIKNNGLTKLTFGIVVEKLKSYLYPIIEDSEKIAKAIINFLILEQSFSKNIDQYIIILYELINCENKINNQNIPKKQQINKTITQRNRNNQITETEKTEIEKTQQLNEGGVLQWLQQYAIETKYQMKNRETGNCGGGGGARTTSVPTTCCTNDNINIYKINIDKKKNLEQSEESTNNTNNNDCKKILKTLQFISSLLNRIGKIQDKHFSSVLYYDKNIFENGIYFEFCIQNATETSRLAYGGCYNKAMKRSLYRQRFDRRTRNSSSGIAAFGLQIEVSKIIHELEDSYTKQQLHTCLVKLVTTQESIFSSLNLSNNDSVIRSIKSSIQSTSTPQKIYVCTEKATLECLAFHLVHKLMLKKIYCERITGQGITDLRRRLKNYLKTSNLTGNTVSNYTNSGYLNFTNQWVVTLSESSSLSTNTIDTNSKEDWYCKKKNLLGITYTIQQLNVSSSQFSASKKWTFNSEKRVIEFLSSGPTQSI